MTRGFTGMAPWLFDCLLSCCFFALLLILPHCSSGERGRQQGDSPGNPPERFSETRSVSLPEDLQRQISERISHARAWLVEHQSKSGAWEGRAFTNQCEPPGACSGIGFDTHDGAITSLVSLSLIATLSDSNREKEIQQSLTQAARWLENHLSNRGSFHFPREQKAYFARSMAALTLLSLSDSDRIPYSLSKQRQQQMIRSITEEIRNVSIRRSNAHLPDCVVPWYDQVIEQDRASSPQRTAAHKKLVAILKRSIEQDAVLTPSIRFMLRWIQNHSQEVELQSLPEKVEYDPQTPMQDLYSAFFFWKAHFVRRDDPDGGRTVPEADYKQMIVDVLERQDRKGSLNGSWPPGERWGPEGGRLYSTAMALLLLTVDRPLQDH